jgi:hypothetical protein
VNQELPTRTCCGKLLSALLLQIQIRFKQRGRDPDEPNPKLHEKRELKKIIPNLNTAFISVPGWLDISPAS